MIIIILGLLIMSFVLLFWQVSNLVSVFFGSPYVKANRQIIIEALKLAHLKKGEIFYDLGCGNGDVLIEAAKMGARAIGFEISPFYYLWAKMRIFIYQNIYDFLRSSVKSHIKYKYRPIIIEIKFQNIYNIDLKKADVVYCYLLPEFLEKLLPKFKKELKSGTRLISIGFPVDYTTFTSPAVKVGKYTIDNHKIYIYKF